MSNTNYPAITAANGFPIAGSNGSSAENRSGVQTFRSFASRLRRPLTSILARFNGETRESHVTDTSLFAICPASAAGPMPLLPRDLSIVDSKELIREILRRVGEDPDREGLQQTPARIVRSWKEIYGGYEQRAEDVLVTQFQAGAVRRNGSAARYRILFDVRASHAPLPWEGTHCLSSE